MKKKSGTKRAAILKAAGFKPSAGLKTTWERTFDTDNLTVRVEPHQAVTTMEDFIGRLVADTWRKAKSVANAENTKIINSISQSRDTANEKLGAISRLLGNGGDW